MDQGKVYTATLSIQSTRPICGRRCGGNQLPFHFMLILFLTGTIWPQGFSLAWGCLTLCYAFNTVCLKTTEMLSAQTKYMLMCIHALSCSAFTSQPIHDFHKKTKTKKQQQQNHTRNSSHFISLPKTLPFQLSPTQILPFCSSPTE